MIYRKMIMAAAIAGIVLSQFSCATQAGSSRKKMPGYLNAESFEPGYYFKTKEARMNEFAFTTANESLMFEGSAQNFMTVAFADPAFDPLVFDLVEQYKPYAALLIDTWVQQGNKGLIIDFRKNTQQAATEATYRVEKAEAFSIPVIFKWDATSSFRAQSYMAVLQNTPGMKATKITN